MGERAITTDADLLLAYAQQRSADAFAELVRRYGSLVHGIGLRITGSREDAQDVAQECFLHLAAEAGRITLPLPSWLHTLARSRSIDAVRRRVTRLKHERQSVRPEAVPLTLGEWGTLCQQVDEAIAELPDELRLPLIAHYLQGETQQQTAARLGVNQATISRRLEKGVAELRAALVRAGVDVRQATLGAALAELAAQGGAPGTLLASLVKIGLSGAASHGASPPVRSMWRIVVAIGIVAALTGAVWQFGGSPAAKQANTGATAMAATTKGAGPVVRRANGRVWIENVPLSKGNENGYLRGMETLLAMTDTPVSYERLMGWSGLAFILQVDTEHRWQGTVDAGWWPLDPWGLAMRRQFLEKAIGRQIVQIGPALAGWPPRDQLAAAYRQTMQKQAEQAIESGRPLLATWCDYGFIVCGYDTSPNEPPLLGHFARETIRTELVRPEWPCGFLMMGERLPTSDVQQVDIAALQYAVDLVHDRAAGELPMRPGCSTGQKGYAAWAALLRNREEKVLDHHHGNVKMNLTWNREAAVAYLRDVASRQAPEAREPLLAAAVSYEEVIAMVRQMRVDGLSQSFSARQAFADQLDRIAAQELESAALISKALEEMQTQPVTAPTR